MFNKTKKILKEEFHTHATRQFMGTTHSVFPVFKNPSKQEYHEILRPVSEVDVAARIIAHKGNVYAWGWDHDTHGGIATHDDINLEHADRADAALIKHKSGDFSLFVHDIDHSEWKKGSKTMQHLQRITHPGKLTVKTEDYY